MRRFFVSILMLHLACKTNPETNLKVTNGIPTTGFPAVRQLNITSTEVNSQGQAERFDFTCTGTFVSPDTLITAAHCVKDAASPGDITVMGRSPINIIFDPNYGFDNNNGVNDLDLAVIIFRRNISFDYVPLALTSARPGDDMTIVGYGNNLSRSLEEMQARCSHLNSKDAVLRCESRAAGEGSGTKRYGTNTVDYVDSMIYFSGVSRSSRGTSRGQMVSSGLGDSGGPLLIDGRLAGNTSGGLPTRSQYVNLLSPSSQVTLRRDVEEGGASITGFNSDLSGPLLTHEDFTFNVTYGNVEENGSSGPKMSFSIELVAAEEALAHVDSLEIQLGSNSLSSETLTVSNNPFKTGQQTTDTLFWKTQGFRLNLKNGRVLDFDGILIDWRDKTDVLQVNREDFIVEVEYGQPETRRFRRWMPFQLKLRAAPEELSQVESVIYDIHHSFGDDWQSLSRDSQSQFASTVLETLVTSWKTHKTIITLRSGRVIVLPGTQISWQ